MVQFRYRYVNYGTVFEPSQGSREGVKAPPETALYENEVVADVGGVCLGHEGCNLMVIDHHFDRKNGNFPAAAAGVLHLAPRIAGHFKSLVDGVDASAGEPTIWLVTHKEPDFDACTSLYLLRGILDGAIPTDLAVWAENGIAQDAWVPVKGENGKPDSKIDWHSPRGHNGMSDAVRVPILLASLAAHVDQCKPITGLRAKSLHALLYAAAFRGSNIHENAGRTLLEAARERISGPHHLNPLIDALFDGTSSFLPERALLDLEEARYARDLRKARRCVVYLQQRPFREWYESAQQTPFLASAGDGGPEVDYLHLNPGGGTPIQADAIYIRDPESILFKEWARMDLDNAPSGKGFLFTAVAYSGGVRDSKTGNTSSYFFSIDPERAVGRHLYNVWARLQARELLEADGRLHPIPQEEGARKGYEGRRLGLDPWFDGSTYAATIVVTPGSGTRMAQGTAGDLSDDEVAECVRRELEDKVFQSVVHLRDCPIVKKETLPGKGENLRLDNVDFRFSSRLRLEDLLWDGIPKEHFRVAAVQLSEGCDLLSPPLAEQIAKRLWPVLEPPGVTTFPSDLVQHHLIGTKDHLVLWNRRGLAVAFLPGSEDSVRWLLNRIEDYAELSCDLSRYASELMGGAIAEDDPQQRRASLRRLLGVMTNLKLAASSPEGLPLRRLFDATQWDEVVESIDSINQQTFEDQEKQRDTELQVILMWVGAFAILASLAQVVIQPDTPLQKLIRDWNGWAIGMALLSAFLPPVIVGWWIKSRSRSKAP